MANVMGKEKNLPETLDFRPRAHYTIRRWGGPTAPPIDPLR